MRRSVPVALVVSLALAVPAWCEEGMWCLDQLPALELADRGLAVTARAIWDAETGTGLARAVVSLGGGTGELVSAEGLVLTNHHVAFGGVQRASAAAGRDWITDGFLARTRAEEVPAPGYVARLLERTEDVTARVLDGIADGPDLVARQRLVDARVHALEKAAEGGREDLEAQVAAMHGGRQYVLFVFRRYPDVRLVYVPPAGIGDFGGDEDNWMWPRHCGDFSFLRVWAAPDGSGREHSADNVPLRSPRWLEVSTGGLAEGDLTFILGYPGSTDRYATAAEIAYTRDEVYPKSIANAEEVLALLDRFAAESDEAAVRVAGYRQGVANGYKNDLGMVEGLRRGDLVEARRRGEDELRAFLAGREDLARTYGDVLDAIAATVDARRELADHDRALGRFKMGGGLLAGAASAVVGHVRERDKPASERDPAFDETTAARDMARLKARYLSFHEGADRALLARALAAVAALPAGQRVTGLDDLLASAPTTDELAARLYAGTRLRDVAFVESLRAMSSAELDAVSDPILDLARRLYPATDAMRRRHEQAEARRAELTRRHVGALLAWRGGPLYPDANRSLRFTWGRVEGYRPRDAVVYLPFTTLAGVIAKDRGQEPFAVPERLKQVAAARDLGRWVDPRLGDVPVAFLHTCDTTGGNSGSPVLDARGRLVGILFDGNWEALTSDWQWDSALQRSISVDLRYVLLVTERVAGATHLLEEMGVAPAP